MVFRCGLKFILPRRGPPSLYVYVENYNYNKLLGGLIYD